MLHLKIMAALPLITGMAGLFHQKQAKHRTDTEPAFVTEVCCCHKNAFFFSLSGWRRCVYERSRFHHCRCCDRAVRRPPGKGEYVLEV